MLLERRFDQLGTRGRRDLLPHLAGHGTEPPPDRTRRQPRRPRRAGGRASGPRSTRPAPTASARARVLATIAGLDPAQPLGAAEVVRRPRPTGVARRRRRVPEWLLPGRRPLPDDAVIAVETNPRVRRRRARRAQHPAAGRAALAQHPGRTGCTPLRSVLGPGRRRDAAAVSTTSSAIHTWSHTGDLGDPRAPAGRRCPDATWCWCSADGCSCRYPATVLYLISAEHGGSPNFDRRPGARRRPGSCPRSRAGSAPT